MHSREETDRGLQIRWARTRSDRGAARATSSEQLALRRPVLLELAPVSSLNNVLESTQRTLRLHLYHAAAQLGRQSLQLPPTAGSIAVRFCPAKYMPAKYMKQNAHPTKQNRQIVRKLTLSDEGNGPVYSSMTPEQRFSLVWPLTLSAWQFANPDGFEPRLQRHIARVERR